MNSVGISVFSWLMFFVLQERRTASLVVLLTSFLVHADVRFLVDLYLCATRKKEALLCLYF